MCQYSLVVCRVVNGGVGIGVQGRVDAMVMGSIDSIGLRFGRYQ